jgi:hypothetical protein
MIQQRILIVLESGAFQGASITNDTGSPVPLDLTDLTALLPDLNAAAILAADAGQSAVSALAGKDAEIEVLTARIAELTATPETIANWRAKAVLALAGFIPAVEAALDGMAEPARTVARYAWDGGADFARTGPTVLALAAALGLTDAQLDAMFSQAASLQV